MWYKNIASRFFGLVTKHACDRQTDRQNYDSRRAVKVMQILYSQIPLRYPGWRPGRRPGCRTVASWNLARQQRASMSQQVRDQLASRSHTSCEPASFELSRHVEIARTYVRQVGNQVCETSSPAGRRPPIARASSLRDRPNSSSLQVYDHLRPGLRPGLRRGQRNGIWL